MPSGYLSVARTCTAVCAGSPPSLLAAVEALEVLEAICRPLDLHDRLVGQPQKDQQVRVGNTAGSWLAGVTMHAQGVPRGMGMLGLPKSCLS